MVVEHLFPQDWLERKLRYAFILAFIYSALSLVLASLLFPKNSGIVAVMFASLLLLPYIQKLFLKEELKELHEKKNATFFSFLLDTLPAMKVYAMLFLGVYVAFMLFAFTLPLLSFDTGVVFREQLALSTNTVGSATASGVFQEIFLNNWWVVLACFLLAVVAGDGAIFFIVWNASVWGAIFGFRALAAATVQHPLLNLISISALTLPHVLLEAGAYILAAIAGGVISVLVVSKAREIPIFLLYLFAGLLGYFLLLLVLVAFGVSKLLFVLCAILFLIALLRALAWAFDTEVLARVYVRNYYLFLGALVLLLLGSLVEMYVLGNSSLLYAIYSAA